MYSCILLLLVLTIRFVKMKRYFFFFFTTYYMSYMYELKFYFCLVEIWHRMSVRHVCRSEGAVSR